MLYEVITLVSRRQVQAGNGHQAQYVPLLGEAARGDVVGGAARKLHPGPRPDPEVPTDHLPVVPQELARLLEVGDPELGKPGPGEEETPSYNFV